MVGLLKQLLGAFAVARTASATVAIPHLSTDARGLHSDAAHTGEGPESWQGEYCPEGFFVTQANGTQDHGSYTTGEHNTHNATWNLTTDHATCAPCPAGQTSNGGASPTCFADTFAWSTCTHLACRTVSDNHCNAHTSSNPRKDLSDGTYSAFKVKQHRCNGASNNHTGVARISVFHHGHESAGTMHKCKLSGTRLNATDDRDCICQCRSTTTAYPTVFPTAYPTASPTKAPTAYPTAYPTASPTKAPTKATEAPTAWSAPMTLAIHYFGNVGWGDTTYIGGFMASHGNAVQVTDALILDFVQNHDCTQYRTIWLPNCPSLTDAAALTLASHCPNIRKIHMDSSGITDVGLVAMARAMPQLENVRVGGTSLTSPLSPTKWASPDYESSAAHAMTDASLHALADNCPNLFSLVISQGLYSYFTDAGLYYLSSNLPNLGVIRIIKYATTSGSDFNAAAASAAFGSNSRVCTSFLGDNTGCHQSALKASRSATGGNYRGWYPADTNKVAAGTSNVWQYYT